MDTKTLVATLSTLLTSALGALIAVYLKDWLEERRTRRGERRADLRSRVRIDRATCNQRQTVLIRVNLAAYIRSGQWHSDEPDLRRLISDLEGGSRPIFLDRDVNPLWSKLVHKTLLLAKARLDGTITETDIRFYDVMCQEWEQAVRRSLGRIPRAREITRPRRVEDAKDRAQDFPSHVRRGPSRGENAPRRVDDAPEAGQRAA